MLVQGCVNDLLLHKDYFVILSKNIKEHISLEKIKKVGYLSLDKKILTNYFNDDIELVEYEKEEDLFNAIWGFDSESEPQTLTVHIKFLREKFEEDPKNPKRILTVWGVGYRFE